jgi:phospholipid/cholesterol/gamma-HCH transport system substrate-binding protein
MKFRTVELTVGVFMIAGILSLAMLAMQVSGLKHVFSEDTGYKVYAEFTNIGGLKSRAKVSIGGVVVGRVVKITLEPNTFYAKVEFLIDPEQVKKLPADTRASILTAGLLGDNYIGLSPGFDDSKFLQEGSLITIENTDSAVILEQLISKFVAGQASNLKSEEPKPLESSHGSKPLEPQGENHENQ